MKLIDKITLPFYRIRNTFRDAYYNLKYRCQRFVRGYADEDIWNIDNWFLESMRKILPEYIKRSNGHPVAVNEDEWEDILSAMNQFLNLMDIDDVAIKIFEKESYELSDEEARNAEKIADINKEQFFYTFSKYFNHLWY